MVTRGFDEKFALRIYLILGTLEGILSLVWFFLMPSDPKNAWLLGYSRYRILFIVVDLFGTAVFVWILIKSLRNPEWLNKAIGSVRLFFQKKYRITFIWVIFLVGVFLTVTALWLATKEHWTIWVLPVVYMVGDYLGRLIPLLVWLLLFCVQTLSFLWLFGYKVRLGYLVLQVISVMVYPGLLTFFSSLHPNYLTVISREDYIIEWLTVLFFVLTALVAIIFAVVVWRKKRIHYWFLILLAGACFLFALEEISWGQRFFNLESPEFFIEHSDQQEINVHNVVSELLTVRTKHIAALVMVAYGVVLPIFVYLPVVRNTMERLHVLIPPKILIPGFLLSSFLTWDRYFNGKDEEIAELFFSSLLFLVLIFNFWQLVTNDQQGFVQSTQ
jgi:hypothetical protein